MTLTQHHIVIGMYIRLKWIMILSALECYDYFVCIYSIFQEYVITLGNQQPKMQLNSTVMPGYLQRLAPTLPKANNTMYIFSSYY
jgi:hypothetical protein